MAFKLELVAPRELAASNPYLGFDVTKIVLEQPNGEGAALPALPSPDDRSKVLESVIGSDSKVERNKRAELEFEVDYIDGAKKAEIERLFHDGRDVYINPNFDQSTRWSFPFLRDVTDVTGRRTVAVNHSSAQYQWDEVDKVMRSWAANDGAWAFHGAWSRYWTGSTGVDNQADKRHPDSTSTGWSTIVGTATIAYTEDILTPVLARRNTTNQKGVAKVEGQYSGGTAAIIEATASSSINASLDLAMSVVIAWSGRIILLAKDSAGNTVGSETVTGDGTFQMLHVGGPNTSGGTSASLQIVFLDTTTQYQTALIGPVCIGSSLDALGDPVFDGWNEGGDLNDIIRSDSVEDLAPEWTISFFARYATHRLGWLEKGSPDVLKILKTEAAGTDSLTITHIDNAGAGTNTSFANLASSNGLSEGDWFHVALVATIANGFQCYINGSLFGTGGTLNSWFPGDYLRFGNVAGTRGLGAKGGISHMRMDARPWSASEVRDHYHTYFTDAGRGIVEPVFGRLGRIVDLDFDRARSGGADNAWQYTGSITWVELETKSWAPIQPQEGDV